MWNLWLKYSKMRQRAFNFFEKKKSLLINWVTWFFSIFFQNWYDMASRPVPNYRWVLEHSVYIKINNSFKGIKCNCQQDSTNLKRKAWIVGTILNVKVDNIVWWLTLCWPSEMFFHTLVKSSESIEGRSYFQDLIARYKMEDREWLASRDFFRYCQSS